MKLDNIEFELEWPKDINIVDLRGFIISNFPKEVEIIRWSINDIKFLNNKTRKNLIKVSAAILN
tara:strand:- start:497 stop:688 length:192 start_codon:yes stop_codon:yes gene_type:complete